jgi:methanogenic corrinoid protein MtbC1
MPELFEFIASPRGTGGVTPPLYEDAGPPDLPHISRTLEDDSWRDSIGRIIEAEIIPRLMLANSDAAPPRGEASAPAAAGIDHFTMLVLGREGGGALDYALNRRAHGDTTGALFLSLLAPTARRLGALWESDHCDFLDVSAALGRLQRIVRVMSPAWPEHVDAAAPQRRALFALAPGETHGLGLSIVEEFFRAAGWTADRAASEGICAALRAEWHAIVGFSIACRSSVERLRAAVVNARRASANRSIIVMVGGALRAEEPDLARLVGADFAPADAVEAVAAAQDVPLPIANSQSSAQNLLKQPALT